MRREDTCFEDEEIPGRSSRSKKDRRLGSSSSSGDPVSVMGLLEDAKVRW